MWRRSAKSNGLVTFEEHWLQRSRTKGRVGHGRSTSQASWGELRRCFAVSARAGRHISVLMQALPGQFFTGMRSRF